MQHLPAEKVVGLAVSVLCMAGCEGFQGRKGGVQGRQGRQRARGHGQGQLQRAGPLGKHEGCAGKSAALVPTLLLFSMSKHEGIGRSEP